MTVRSNKTIQRARKLRQAGNLPEALLWNELKSRRLAGHKFVRQFPIGPYIADFVHRSRRLVIEIDGGQHAGSATDERRDAFIRHQGFAVLRFWSTAVLRDCEAVCNTILKVIEGGYTDQVIAPDLRYQPALPSPPLRGTSPASGRGILD